jgi:chromosome segregation ATPase
MSLTRLTVTNFQSLKNVDLELGLFTVIVGPSSSGKSALIRAVKALASNVRGSGVITRGQKAMAITGRTETHTVTLERSDRTASYKITGEGGNLTFTKLAAGVPEQVTAALRIEPVTEAGSVNFASQFDKPYLLDESGSTVARVLGELTNVNALFEAVRVANRVRQNAASTHRMRQNDLEGVKARLGAFQGLQDRLAALEVVEQLDAKRRNLETQISRLNTQISTVRITQRAIEKATLPPLPAYDRLHPALNRYLDLQAKLRGLIAKQKRAEEQHWEFLAHANDAQHYEQTLADKLKEAGICPTCGQEIH